MLTRYHEDDVNLNVTSLMKHLVTRELLVKFNRKGLNGKASFVECLEPLMKLTILVTHPGARDKEIEKRVYEYLKNISRPKKSAGVTDASASNIEVGQESGEERAGESDAIGGDEEEEEFDI